MSDGLNQVLNPRDLTIVVNTGDDFTHLGLRISPDLDTVCYTLAGMENPETGWGRSNDTWNVLTELPLMGMPDWFKLGDADLATQITRTSLLSQGLALSEITTDFCRRWGIEAHVLPMSDDSFQTWLSTDEGELEFQEYFVVRKCKPVIKQIVFVGAENSTPAPGVLEAIDEAEAIVFCPSNPWVSIDPILAVRGISSALAGKLVIAISPLIGGKTIKGPAAKMFKELGIAPSAFAIGEHYGSIINCLFIDKTDSSMAESIEKLCIEPIITDIVMADRIDRSRLAKEVITFITGKVR